MATRFTSHKAVAAVLGLLLGVGAADALTGFARWYLAAIIGAIATVAGAAAGIYWERHSDHLAHRRSWEAATTAGPSEKRVRRDDNVVESDSILRWLGPGEEVVPFNRVYDAKARATVRAVKEATSRPHVGCRWITIDGPAGTGKTRLLVEASRRIRDGGIEVRWARRECAITAFDHAAALKQPVCLIVDDAETRNDMPDLLAKMASEVASDVCIVIATREFSQWWSGLRRKLKGEQVRLLVTPTRISLGMIEADHEEVQQLFAQALKAFAGASKSRLPEVGISGPDSSLPILLIHASAAVAVHEGLSAELDVDEAVRLLFRVEEEFWLSSVKGPLRDLGIEVLKATIVAAVVIGATSEDDAASRISLATGIADSFRLNQSLLTELVLWVRELYETESSNEWLSPFLPGWLVDRYVVEELAKRPTLASAVASASTGRERRALGRLARAATHVALANTAVQNYLAADPVRLVTVAVDVGLEGRFPIDAGLAAVIETSALPAEILERICAQVDEASQVLANSGIAAAKGMLHRAIDSSGKAYWMKSLGRRQAAIGLHEEALDSTQAAVKLYLELVHDGSLAEHEPKLASSLVDLANRFNQLGQPARTISLVGKAIEIYRRRVAVDTSLEADRRSLAGALVDLGRYRSQLAQPREAEEAALESVQVCRGLTTGINANDRELARSLTALCTLKGTLDSEETVRLLDDSITIWRRLSTLHPTLYDSDLAFALICRCVQLDNIGRFADALRAVDEAISIYERLSVFECNIYSFDLAGALNSRGIELTRLGHRRDGEKCQRDSVKVYEDLERRYRSRGMRLPESRGLDFAAYLVNLASHALTKGDASTALKLARRSVGLYEEYSAGYNDNQTMAYILLGECLSVNGRRVEAIEQAERTVALVEQYRSFGLRHGPSDSLLATALNHLAKMQMDALTFDAAIRSAQRATTLFRTLGKRYPERYREPLKSAELLLAEARSRNAMSK